MFFINQLKIILRNRNILFWTLLFPIALGTFFNLAFYNLDKEEQLKVIDIGVVDNISYQQNTSFSSLMESLSNGQDKMFNMTKSSEDELNNLLNKGKIDGYVIVTDKINLTIKKSTINTTIIKTVIDNYNQNYSAITNIIKINPDILKTNILNTIHSTESHFEEEAIGNHKGTVIYFYTLIGMMCLYGSFFGVYAVNQTEANLSKEGARINVSPTSKIKILLTSLLVALIIQYAEVLITLSYLILILKVSFGSQLLYILLLSFFGSLAGISMGAFIGVVSKKDINGKMGILLAFTMTCSFLAGMMIVDIKYLLEKSAPILGIINPVNLITDGLYALYYYTNHSRFNFDLMCLIIFSLVLNVVTFYKLRRKKYDSI